MNQKPITIFDLIRVLYSRKLLLIGVFIAIVTAGMIVTLLLTPTYQSTMKILVTRDRIDPQVTAAEKNTEGSRGSLSEEEFNSELEILQSRAVIEGVARQIGLDKQYAVGPIGRFASLRDKLAGYYRSFHRQYPPDAIERAVIHLNNHLEVVSVKKSRVIKVSYLDSRPERAAQVLRELYQQYTDHQLRLLQTSKAGNVFQVQTEVFRQKLSEATDELKRFDEQNGLSANTPQRELLLKQLYDIQGELDRARTEIREIEQRIVTLNAQIATQPERIESEARTKYVAARDKIKDEILTLELQRTQLMQKYQPGHRLVKDIEERLAQTRELLAREEQSPPKEHTTVLNEVHRRLTNELLTAQANLTTQREREKSLAAIVRRYKEQGSKFDSKSIERTNLERTRAINEEAYLLYRKKSQEADIVKALNQERIVNFNLAESPGVNHKPISPNLLINLVVLVFIGFLASVAIVVFAERRRLFPGIAQARPLIPDSSHALVNGRRTAPLDPTPLLFSDDRITRDSNQPSLSGSGKLSLDGIRFFPSADPALEEDGASEIGSSDSDGPDPLQVEAVVDFLHRVYRLPPEKLSQVLRRTAGWEISPEELDEILSRAAMRRLQLSERS